LPKFATEPELVTDPRYRELAPSIFSMTGKTHLEYGAPDEYLRFAGQMLAADADALYCSGSLQTVEYLAREGAACLQSALCNKAFAKTVTTTCHIPSGSMAVS